MREIRFRGKRIDNGEWLYGYYWSNDLGNHFIKVTKDENGFCLYDVEVDPATVGQYTGLKDKNGQEIYEGDICQVVDNPLVPPDAYAIVWNDEFASWMWKDNNSEDYFYLVIANTSEVIGNIHDNPEMLGVQNG